MSDTTPDVQRLGSIAFRVDEAEDRIRCIGIPAGVATGHVEMWLTNRLGFRFLESVHETRPDREDTTAPKVGDSLNSMVEYGYNVDSARRETRHQMTRGQATAKAPERQASWLIRKIQVQKIDQRINLILIGDGDAAGFQLEPQEFLRVVDMLEAGLQEGRLGSAGKIAVQSRLADGRGVRTTPELTEFEVRWRYHR